MAIGKNPRQLSARLGLALHHLQPVLPNAGRVQAVGRTEDDASEQVASAGIPCGRWHDVARDHTWSILRADRFKQRREDHRERGTASQPQAHLPQLPRPSAATLGDPGRLLEVEFSFAGTSAKERPLGRRLQAQLRTSGDAPPWTTPVTPLTARRSLSGIRARRSRPQQKRSCRRTSTRLRIGLELPVMPCRLLSLTTVAPTTDNVADEDETAHDGGDSGPG